MAQAAVLAALVVAPLFFNPRTERAFEPDKLAWVVLLGLAAAVALLGMGLAGMGNAAAVARTVRPSVLDAAVVVAAAIYGLGALFSVAPTASVWGEYRRGQGLVAMIGLVAMYAASRAVGRQPGFAALLRRATIVAVAGVAGYALLQRFGHDNVAYAEEEASGLRAFGPLGNPILLGAYLVMVLPLLVGWLADVGRAARSGAARAGRVFAAVGVVLAAGIAALVLAQSRGPALGFVASLAVWAVLVLARARRWRLAAVLTLAVAAGIVVLTSGQLASGRVGRLGELAWGQSRTARERLIVWQTLDGVAAEGGARGLFGYGPDTTLLLLTSRLPEEQARLAPGVVFDDAHNAAWEWWVTGGWPGVAAWLALYVAAFSTGLAGMGLAEGRRARARSAGVMLAAALLGGWSTRVVLGPGTWPVGLMQGLIVGLSAAAVWSAARPCRTDRAAGMPSARASVGGSFFAPALMAALAGHLVESAVGVSGVASELVFWALLGWLAAEPRGFRDVAAAVGSRVAAAEGARQAAAEDPPARTATSPTRAGTPPSRRGAGGASRDRRGGGERREAPRAGSAGWRTVAAIDGLALATVAFAPLLVPGRPGPFGRPALWLLPAALWLLGEVLGESSPDWARDARLAGDRFGPGVRRLVRLAPALALTLIVAAGDAAGDAVAGARAGAAGLGLAGAAALGYAVVLVAVTWFLAAGLPAGRRPWPRAPAGRTGVAAGVAVCAWLAWRTALAPALADAQVRVGAELAAAGLVAEAGARFDRALALWPEQSVYLAHAAAVGQQLALDAGLDSYAAREAFARAEAELLEAERRVPSAEAARLLSSLYRRQGDYVSHPTERLGAWSAAETWFEEGLVRAPHDAEMLVEGAMLRERFGDAAAAEAMYRRAADLRPDLLSARLGLARCLLARGQVSAAAVEVEGAAGVAGPQAVVRGAREAAGLPVPDPQARLALVLALAIAGDRAGAHEALAFVEAVRPPEVNAAPVRAWLESRPAGPSASP